MNSLWENAGRSYGPVDAVQQMVVLSAIKNDPQRMASIMPEYPPSMKGQRMCHIRAMWNLSQDAAMEMLQKTLNPRNS